MNRNSDGNVRIPTHLSLVAWLSCCFTTVVSVVYITLCSLAIYTRNNCNVGVASNSDPGSSFFTSIIVRLYFKQDDCTHALNLSDVTQEQTVFLLVCLTLAVSVACLILAVGFIAVLNIENGVKYVQPMGYCYIAIILVSIANDLATGTHFGMDYSTFTELVNGSSSGVSENYQLDMYRLGALFLMAVSLKGFMIHIFNIVFISLLIAYLVELNQQLQNEHSIHKVGALTAFEQPRRMDEQSENSFQPFRTPSKRNDDPWQNASESNYTPYRGPQSNPMFVNDEETPRRLQPETPRSEYTNPSFDRSYSWLHNQPALGSRPFSYLEDNKRQAPMNAPSPVNKEPQWQRNPWDAQSPPVPAPDYSPETPRRLKSALKSSYM